MRLFLIPLLKILTQGFHSFLGHVVKQPLLMLFVSSFQILSITFLNLVFSYCLLLHSYAFLCHPTCPGIYIAFLLFYHHKNFYILKIIIYVVIFSGDLGFFKLIERKYCMPVINSERIPLAIFQTQTI